MAKTREIKDYKKIYIYTYIEKHHKEILALMKEEMSLLFTCSSVGGHGVCLRCLTWEIWRPKLRWTLQHSSQIRIPLFIDAQQGSEKEYIYHNHRRQRNFLFQSGKWLCVLELCILTLALLLSAQCSEGTPVSVSDRRGSVGQEPCRKRKWAARRIVRASTLQEEKEFKTSSVLENYLTPNPETGLRLNEYNTSPYLMRDLLHHVRIHLSNCASQKYPAVTRAINILNPWDVRCDHWCGFWAELMLCVLKAMQTNPFELRLTRQGSIYSKMIAICMGTVESWPEPLIDHLRRALSQPQGHRWMHFHLSDQKGWSLAPRPPFKGWLPMKKVLYLEITPLEALLWAQDTGKLFISLLLCKCDNLSGPIPLYLTICIPVCHTLSHSPEPNWSICCREKKS